MMLNRLISIRTYFIIKGEEILTHQIKVEREGAEGHSGGRFFSRAYNRVFLKPSFPLFSARHKERETKRVPSC